MDITKFDEYTIIMDKNYITIYTNDLELNKIDITVLGLIAFYNPFFNNKYK